MHVVGGVFLYFSKNGDFFWSQCLIGKTSRGKANVFIERVNQTRVFFLFRGGYNMTSNHPQLTQSCHMCLLRCVASASASACGGFFSYLFFYFCDFRPCV